jgi:hypothetical protein
LFLQKNSAISSFFSTDLSHILFGTSSSAYEGWRGLVCQRTDPKSRFSQDALAEYAGYAVDEAPLFSTIGIAFSLPTSQRQAIGTLRRASARALSLLLKNLGRDHHPGLSESSPLRSQSRETQPTIS